jgi:hypothetical protein
LFGFLRPENLLGSFVLYGIITGFWGSSGYILATWYNPPLAVMNTFLLEPFIGQLVGVWLKIDIMPGSLTWISVLMIIIAINLQYIGQNQEEAAERREAEMSMIDEKGEF